MQEIYAKVKLPYAEILEFKNFEKKSLKIKAKKLKSQK